MRGHTPTAFGTQTRLGGWLGREETSCPGSIGASATAPWGLRAHVDGCHCASRIDNLVPFLMLAWTSQPKIETMLSNLKTRHQPSGSSSVKVLDAIASHQRVPCLEALCRHGDEPLPGTRIARLERIWAATTGMVKRDGVRVLRSTPRAAHNKSFRSSASCSHARSHSNRGVSWQDS